MNIPIKFLIAEHDRIDLELINHELQQSGIDYLSQAVQTKREFVHCLHHFHPDIILSDYTFPSFDGPTAFQLREEFAPGIPFIFVSGTIGEEKSIELIINGVTDFCLKDKLFTLNQKVFRALKESKASFQQKQVDSALIESEKQLARAQQVAHMGNWELDFAANDFHWSDEIFRIYGLDPHQNRQSLESVMSFIHIEDVASVISKIKESRDKLHDFSITYRIVQKTGAVRHVYFDSKLEYGSDGKATGLFGIAHDVTEMVLLENTLARERITRQTEITEAVLTAQEDERAAIGKELHENLNQMLGATKLYIELAQTDEAKRAIFLDKSTKHIADVIDLIRKISKSLDTPNPNTMGLVDCIKILSYDLSQAHPIKIMVEVNNIVEKALGEKLQLNIYRMVQEQLHNILHHAKATKVTINLSTRGNEVVLIITDNGKGYNVDMLTKGVSIRNIMSRAEYLSGRTEITATAGKGYELRVELPLHQPESRTKTLTQLL